MFVLLLALIGLFLLLACMVGVALYTENRKQR